MRCFYQETSDRGNIIKVIQSLGCSFGSILTLLLFKNYAYIPPQLNHLLERVLLLPARDPSFEKLGDDLPDLEKSFKVHTEKIPEVTVELDLPMDPRGTF